MLSHAEIFIYKNLFALPAARSWPGHAALQGWHIQHNLEMFVSLLDVTQLYKGKGQAVYRSRPGFRMPSD
jgi:hypothetical protein